MICGQLYEFSATELAYIADLKMTENIGNLMSANDRVLESDALARLRQFVDEQIVVYKEKLLSIKHENEIYITQSWINVADSNQFHPKHKHPNSVISGVLFLDGNDDVQLPPIRFHRSKEMFPLEFDFDELNEFNAACRSFEPRAGMLMLFPSRLEHDVDKNLSSRQRRSLSFNTYVRGPIGNRAQLTEVSIA